LIDRVVAVPGWLASLVRRAVGGSTRATWVVVAVLVLMSALPTIAIGSSQRPTDLTFDDVRLQQIPANTTWVRLEGELVEVKNANGSVYHLYAEGDPEHYIIVTAPVPLDVGHVVLTGHLSLGAQGAGTIGFLDADVPPVPRRDEPFQLILLPAVIAILIAVGMRLGYPVIRRDRRPRSQAAALPTGATLAAGWSGRIESQVVAHGQPIACAISLAPDPKLPELSDLVLDASGASWSVRLRRSAPTRPIRSCRLGGSKPGVEIHAQTADVVLVFDDLATRDRLLATLR
jgi:hypothetical protein